MSEHEYPVHPVADLFPMLEGEAYEALKADIAANGQVEPIATMCDGTLLDGRNRLRACRELGIDPKVIGHGGKSFDPVKWIISRNLYRRHLTESQRALVAAGIAKLKRGKPSNDNSSIDPLSMSTAGAAVAMQVSEASVKRAKEVSRTAAPEVVELVKSGEITINAAQNFAKAIPDKKDQAAIASKGPAEVKRVVSTAADIKRMESAAKDSQAQRATAKASTKAVESAAPAPAINVATGGDPDAVALAALKAAKNPCVTIEKWLRQAQPDQVSQIWSLVDEMLATGKGGRK